jgi:hypothetical protein
MLTILSGLSTTTHARSQSPRLPSSAYFLHRPLWTRQMPRTPALLGAAPATSSPTY